MSPSRFRLAISALLLLAGCPHSQTCGPGSASATLVVNAGGMQLVYSGLSASANNDCPDPTAPHGVVALTISNARAECSAGECFTVCTGRPDLLDQGLSFGTNAILVDVSGTVGSCSFTLAGAAASGTLDATGACANGTDHAGFAMTLDAGTMLAQSCGGTPTQVSTTITGTVAVAGP
jgi:hypothetical protein